MARKPLVKELHNARLLKEYASWVYCTACEKTVAYLCYVTYDQFVFDFVCGCGSHGSVRIAFGEVENATVSTAKTVLMKNRLCCPQDESPLLTLVEKNLTAYTYEITCKACAHTYSGSMP